MREALCVSPHMSLVVALTVYLGLPEVRQIHQPGGLYGFLGTRFSIKETLVLGLDERWRVTWYRTRKAGLSRLHSRWVAVLVLDD